MNLTKSQKIWLGLLGVGVCALAADQLLGSTDPAAAAVAAVTRLVTGDNGPPAPVADVATATPSLTARLAALAGAPSEAVHDAFATPASWKPEAVVTQTPTADPAADFKRSHTLKGVFRSSHGDRVLVDGELLAVGQSIGGFKLIALRRLRATFARDGVRAELAMPDAQNADAARNQPKFAGITEP